MNGLRAILAILVLVSAAGCSRPAGPAAPGGKLRQRIVSFSPAITRILFDMGLGERGVGVGHLTQIQLLGEPLETARVADFQLSSGSDFFGHTGVLRFLQGRLVAKPVLAAERCQGCWVCVEHCPAGALSKNGQQPAFDYGKCICCYCCQELCPNNAIELRRPLLARMLDRRDEGE